MICARVDARAVVFDFSGTLTVSATRASRVAGAARVAAVLGIPADRFHAAIVSTFSERATGSCGDASQTMQWLAEQCGRSPSAAQIAAACAVRLANEEVDTRALRDDAEAAVSTLHDAGYRLGLISDCTHELPEIWPSLPIAPYFDATVFSVEIGVRKPHLDTYRTVTDALGVDPSDCLYVGDGGSNELTGARQAGLRAIQLLTSDAADAIVYDLDTWDGPTIRSLSEIIGVAASPSGDPIASKRQLPHGYTNESWSDDAGVHKRYSGPDAKARMHIELEAILAMAGRVPTAEIAAVDEELGVVTFTRVPGRHGQELLDEGRGAEVLASTGRMLLRLQGEPAGDGSVFVHGDYGPQNLLFDPHSFDVVAMLDWEHAHRGRAVEDLAWAEWIVRTHHPSQVPALDALFDGYGHRPSWRQRQAAMIRSCQVHRDAAARAADQATLAVWQERITTTRTWQA